MVSLSEIQASNALISTVLPAGLVAVFVGATSGIGETTLKQFAKHARQPRVYFVGRSQEAGDRITAECKTLNPQGDYHFMKADTSLIRNVDDVCEEIKRKEKMINVLVLSTGTLLFQTETPEGLHLAAALVTYSRNRFIANLLPLIQRAPSLRRVLTIFAGGKEGPVSVNDFQGWKVPMLSGRGHLSSIVTLSLEALAKKAPEVSFIHDFPGPVKSNLVRGGEGVAILIMKMVSMVMGPFINIPTQESGERHVFLATSARYPASKDGNVAAGVPVADEGLIAKGTIGKSGSGVYTVDQNCESAGPKVEKLLAGMRKEGLVEKVWEDEEEQFRRITGAKTA